MVIVAIACCPQCRRCCAASGPCGSQRAPQKRRVPHVCAATPAPSAAFNNLKHRPYSQFRMANLTVRLQVGCRVWGGVPGTAARLGTAQGCPAGPVSSLLGLPASAPQLVRPGCVSTICKACPRCPCSNARLDNTARLAVQVRMRSLSIMFFTLCVICYTFVKLGTCSRCAGQPAAREAWPARMASPVA